MESFHFIQLAKAHKPVICENSESAGAKYRHRGVVEYTEVGDYPNTRLTTPGAQSILLSHGHQRGNEEQRRGGYQNKKENFKYLKSTLKAVGLK